MTEERERHPTEEPTPKRLEEARRMGDVPVSRDAMGVAALLGASVAVAVTAAAGFARVAVVARDAWSGRAAAPLELLREALWASVVVLAPVLLAAAVLASAVGLLQTRALLTFRALSPAWRWRLVPVPWNVARSLLIGLGASVVLLLGLPGILRGAALLPRASAGQTLQTVAAMVGIVGGSLVGTAGLIGVADVLVRRWAWRRRMRMTLREVLRERREVEGDPWLAEERRRTHREQADL